jgi:hypothetical protein
METLNIITMLWALITSFFLLFTNITGIGIFTKLIIKFLCLITVIWFGYKLILLLP